MSEVQFEAIINREGNWDDAQIRELSGDEFGNYIYVMQRIIEYASAAEQTAIADVGDRHYVQHYDSVVG
jgi:hypothetical protein